MRGIAKEERCPGRILGTGRPVARPFTWEQDSRRVRKRSTFGHTTCWRPGPDGGSEVLSNGRLRFHLCERCLLV